MRDDQTNPLLKRLKRQVMKMIKTLVVAVFACALLAGVALAGEPGKCCAKAKAEGKTCDHKCCVAAAKDGKECEKCGGKGEIKKEEKKEEKK
jgi:hypothetical protein